MRRSSNDGGRRACQRSSPVGPIAPILRRSCPSLTSGRSDVATVHLHASQNVEVHDVTSVGPPADVAGRRPARDPVPFVFTQAGFDCSRCSPGRCQGRSRWSSSVRWPARAGLAAILHCDAKVDSHQRKGGEESYDECRRIGISIEPADAAETNAERGPAHSRCDRETPSPAGTAPGEHSADDADEEAKQKNSYDVNRHWVGRAPERSVVMANSCSRAHCGRPSAN